jgi:type II secretory pathway component PulF
LYRTWGRLLDAGLAGEALYSHLLHAFRATSAREAIERIREAAARGSSIADAVQAAKQFPPHHVRQLASAESAGVLPQVFHGLATDDEHESRANRMLVRRAIYPILLFHAAVLAPTVAPFLTEGPRALLPAAGAIALVDLALGALGWLLLRGDRSDRAASAVLRVPVLATALVARTYRHYLDAIRHAYDAGVGLPRSVRESVDAIGNSVLRGEVRDALAARRADEPFAQTVRALPRLPEDVVVLVDGAEPVGELSRALEQSVVLLREREERATARFVAFVGGGLYTAAIVFVAARVLSFYADYYGGLVR